MIAGNNCVCPPKARTRKKLETTQLLKRMQFVFSASNYSLSCIQRFTKADY